MAKQVEGIIYVTAHERVLKCIPENFSIPSVLAYGYTKSGKFLLWLWTTNMAHMRRFSILIERGHKKIGVIMGKE